MHAVTVVKSGTKTCTAAVLHHEQSRPTSSQCFVDASTAAHAGCRVSGDGYNPLLWDGPPLRDLFFQGIIFKGPLLMDIRDSGQSNYSVRWYQPPSISYTSNVRAYTRSTGVRVGFMLRSCRTRRTDSLHQPTPTHCNSDINHCIMSFTQSGSGCRCSRHFFMVNLLSSQKSQEG